jgi:hypothetical protein
MPIDIAESDLTFSFDNAVVVDRFDDARHGMTHVMKCVDFIVQFPNETWLIEVKDPESGQIAAGRTHVARESFRRKMRSGTLYTRELGPKLRDTLVYLCLSRRSPTNRIVYVVFIGLARLNSAMLLTARNNLKRRCYLPGPHGQAWPSNFDVVVANVAAWNASFHPHSVRRGP